MEEVVRKSTDPTLSEYLDVIRRRRAILIQTVVIAFVIGLVVTFLSKPVYRTRARILVEGKSVTVAQYSGSDPLSTLFMPDTGHDVATQIEVLQGQKLIADAYEAAGVPPGAVKLDIREVGITDVIELTAESNNASYAENLAKSLPDTYREYFTGNRKTEIINALSFARNRLSEETKNLAKSQKKLQEVQRASRIYSVENERKARIEESAAADNILQKSKMDVEGEQTRLDSLMKERAAQIKALETQTETSNPQIGVIQAAINQLQDQRAGLLVLYRPTNTHVKVVDAEIAAMQADIRRMPPFVKSVSRTTNPILTAMNDKISQTHIDLATAKAEYASAKVRANRSEARLLAFGDSERLQAQTEADVDRFTKSVTDLSKSVEDLSLREKATHDPVTTITAAGKAVQIAPKKMDNLVKAGFIGLLLGLVLALLQEYLDDRVNFVEDALRVLNTVALGYIPLIEQEDARLLLNSRKRGSLLESYRVVRANVQFASVDTPTQSLLITSTVPGEGKSVTASNLAVAMALDERRVILVDADLRRPTIHKKFNVVSQPGLTNVLLGQVSLEDTLRETNIPGLRILTSGPAPPNPAEMLNSQAMRQLHALLKSYADIVIFDSPPMLSAADAQVLTAETDGIIYVVQFGETKKSALRHAAQMIQQSRARVLGVIFNKIVVGGKDTPYYYGYYHGYHASKVEDDALSAGIGKSPVPSNGVNTESKDLSNASLLSGRHETEEK